MRKPSRDTLPWSPPSAAFALTPVKPPHVGTRVSAPRTPRRARDGDCRGTPEQFPVRRPSMPHRHGYDGPVAIRGATCNDAGPRPSTTRRRRGTAQGQPPPSSAVPHGVSVPHPGHGDVLAAGGRGAVGAAGGCHGVGAEIGRAHV